MQNSRYASSVPFQDPSDQVSERFLQFSERHPELRRRSHFNPFFAAVRKASPSVCGVDTDLEPPIHPWPVWIEPPLARRLQDTSLALARLFRSLPGRVFGGAPESIADLLGLEVSTTRTLLTEPHLLEQTLFRGDFLLTADGPKMLEANFGNLGGWQFSVVEEPFLERPDIERFLEQEGLRARCTGGIRPLFHHVLNHALDHPLEDGVLQLLIVISNQGSTSHPAHPKRAYQRELLYLIRDHFPEAAVRLRIATVDELSFPNGEVHAGGVRCHAVIEQNDTEPVAEIYRAFKAGLVHCYTTSLGMILGDKRWLALLSALGDGEADGGVEDLALAPEARLNAEERQLVAATIPWTRRLSDREATFRGNRGPLPELLLRHRQELVLKAAQGYGGAEVWIGSEVEEERWQKMVDQALTAGDWIAQERIEPVMPRMQQGEEGVGPHRVIWGLFVFGEHYGGAFLRVAPKGSSAVVNVTQGARVGLALDVVPA